MLIWLPIVFYDPTNKTEGDLSLDAVCQSFYPNLVFQTFLLWFGELILNFAVMYNNEKLHFFYFFIALSFQ